MEIDQSKYVPPHLRKKPPFLQIKNISKTFSEQKVVDHINLDIYQEELFCLLGGSGSGKTTLLRIISGFEQQTTGSIILDGKDISNVPAHKRPVNMMFQSYALFPHMSVKNNVSYGLKQDKLPQNEIKDKTLHMLELVNMQDYAARKPHQLSGGQRQRVALARALVKEPKLLLLDEPLAALDKKLRKKTQFELINIQEKLGMTFIVVTHDQEEAMTLSTRIGLMNEGKLVQVGQPHEIYEFPNSLFVADFIGDTNIFDGVVIEDEAQHVIIDSNQMDTPIYVAHGISCAPSQKVSFAIRPEKISISRTNPNKKNNQTHGVIEEIAYVGSFSILRISLKNNKLVQLFQSNLDRWQENALSCDETVYIYWEDNAGIVLTT